MIMDVQSVEQFATVLTLFRYFFPNSAIFSLISKYLNLDPQKIKTCIDLQRITSDVDRQGDVL